MSSSPRDSAAFELREVLSDEGCPVCRLAARSVARLLQSIAYEQVNDLTLRHVLRTGGGFCNVHAHQWLREARSVLGTALIYRDVVRTALRSLESGAVQNGQARRLLRGLLGPERPPAQGSCPACSGQYEAEDRYVEALVAVLGADEDAAAQFQGVCRRHALAAARLGGPGADVVVDRTRQTMEALLEDLDEVIRKEDYRYRDEARTPGERSAAARAVAWAAGDEGLVER